ncbi:MAG: asparaginase domain-containing protein [Phycisphaerales bacterium]|nr:asparaginase domain-containing protein [Phycisphaerales bacterium]
MRHVTLITTGGTIEKTYDEMTGTLENRQSIVRRMLEQLRLEETTVSIVELMSKDSLVMTEEDRVHVLEAAQSALAGAADGVVILHGTDTLAQTGELLASRLGDVTAPVVLAGAMRPFEMVRSDALQNLTEAVFATGVLSPGVYCVAHGRALRFPGVVKDRSRGTFVGGAGTGAGAGGR